MSERAKPHAGFGDTVAKMQDALLDPGRDIQLARRQSIELPVGKAREFRLRAESVGEALPVEVQVAVLRLHHVEWGLDERRTHVENPVAEVQDVGLL